MPDEVREKVDRWVIFFIGQRMITSKRPNSSGTCDSVLVEDVFYWNGFNWIQDIKLARIYLRADAIRVHKTLSETVVSTHERHRIGIDLHPLDRYH